MFEKQRPIEDNVLNVEFASNADRICRDLKFAAFLASEIYSPDGRTLAKKRDLNQLTRRISDEMWSLQIPLRLKISTPANSYSYITRGEQVTEFDPLLYVATGFRGIDQKGVHFFNREEKTELHFSGYNFEIREVTEDEIVQGL